MQKTHHILDTHALLARGLSAPSRFRLGGAAHKVAAHAGCAVAVVGIAEIVWDFPAASADEPEYAHGADLALMQRALLHTAETNVWAALDRLHMSGVQIFPIVRIGQPAAEIVRIVQEQDANLLVIGARGQTRAERFPLGGVAEKLVRFAPCSVLVAR